MITFTTFSVTALSLYVHVGELSSTFSSPWYSQVNVCSPSRVSTTTVFSSSTLSSANMYSPIMYYHLSSRILNVPPLSLNIDYNEDTKLKHILIRIWPPHFFDGLYQNSTWKLKVEIQFHIDSENFMKKYWNPIDFLLFCRNQLCQYR